MRNAEAESHERSAPRSDGKVTPLSSVHDLVWDYSSIWLDQSVAANRKKLRWDYVVPYGHRLSDPEHLQLRKSAQRLLQVAQIADGNPWKPSTTAGHFDDLKHLVRYMIARRVKSFRELSAAQADGFITEVMASNFAPATKVARLRVFHLAYHYRDTLSDALTFDPFHGESSFAVGAPDPAELRLRRTDLIPDAVASKLVRTAAEVIKTADVLVGAHLAREQATPARGNSRGAWDRARNKAMKMAGVEDGLELTRKITLIRSACLIVIHFFSGIRKGESASFGTASLEVDPDGTVWLAGRTFKIRERDARWQVPPIVESAASVAARIAEPYRAELKEEKRRLKCSVQAARGADREAIKARLEEIDLIKDRIFLTAGGSRTQLACEGATRVGVLTNTYDCLRDFVEYFDIRHEGELWPLALHQFRPTFARFMAANMMNFRYLQEHFKHDSPDMTAWYDSGDLEMTGLIADFYEQLKRDVLDGVLGDGPIIGKGAAQIRAEQAEHFRGMVTEEGADQFRNSLAKALHFKSTGISYCLGVRDRGMCGGVAGCVIDPRNVEECDNAFAPPEFLPAWENMERRCLKALQAPDLGVAERKKQQDLLSETIRPIIEHLRGGGQSDEK